MAAAVLGLRELLQEAIPPWALAASSVALGAAVYVVVVWFGFNGRVRTLIDTARLIRGRPAASPAAAD
jgi:hypothetical protein